MADVWDIAQYVETHPDDYEQRWRLAKKLYLAWEYRLALEHLLVLKNEWEDRPNVRRYLGATLFRLQRYDDAIKELEEAARLWPDDVAVRQQLARVLAAADKKPQAAEVWTEILEIEPEHEFGHTVLTKLKEPKVKKQERPRRSSTKLRPVSPPGAVPRRELGQTEVVCQSCGARNGPEFSECWQCHGSLAYALPYEAPADDHLVPPPVRMQENPVPWVAFGLAIVAMLAAAMYLALTAMFPESPPPVGSRIPVTMVDFYFFDMGMTRLVGGLVLLVAWPIAFRIADYLLGIQTTDNRHLAAAGVFLGAAACLIAWLPRPYPFYGALALPLAALVICTAVFRVRLHQGLMLWLVQGLIVLLVLGSVLAAFHGFDMIRDLPVIARAAQRPESANVHTWTTSVPDEMDFVVRRSNSSWLNRHANRIAIEAKTGPLTRRAFVELNRDGQVLKFEEMSENGIIFEYHEIVPGKPYELIVSGEEGVAAEVQVRGLLPVELATPVERPDDEAADQPAESEPVRPGPDTAPDDNVLDG